MKKSIISAFILCLTIYSVYYDLNVGTIPSKIAVSVSAAPPTSPQSNDITYQLKYEKVMVERGYTVLSIVEELHVGPVKASIQQIIADFEALNPGTNASKIQIGKEYLFPLY